MKVLLVGAGAREHAIAEQVSKGAKLYSIMPKKHPGIAKLSEEFLIHDPTDASVVAQWAKSRSIEVAFVSPDALLADGVTDTFAEVGIPVASPTKKAARIEWDKGYARSLMQRNEIPGCPALKICSSLEEAKDALKEIGAIVVKPLGLTGGKGVRIQGEHLNSEEEVLAYCAELLEKDGNVLLEEKLEGEEFTLQAFCDGNSLSLMPPVQDHKRAFEGDSGPNTGGMGSYSTGALLPFLEQKDLDAAKSIMEAVLSAMRDEGSPFTGVLYGQFIATKAGIKVIEFNARFGDPEAMNVLSLLKTPLPQLFLSMSKGELVPAEFSPDCTVVKYAVPEGYPEKGKADELIMVNEQKIWDLGAKLYFGSVYQTEKGIFTSTSRTAAAVAHAQKLSEAEKAVEGALSCISGPLWHRKDIGTQELVKRRIAHIRSLRT
ncbi:phosphoribosylamine--glycine ligase [Candidatus Micrarchaeota archaeon]|nr:phosphoribosylamine--glycine ligase [Candidatus Micrarchaeota archaeon]